MDLEDRRSAVHGRRLDLRISNVEAVEKLSAWEGCAYHGSLERPW